MVVEGIQELDQLATVRWTESVPVTRETGGDILDRLFNGERVLVIATGEAEAGVDLGDIGKDDVSVNQFHKWAHMDTPPAFVSWLQEWGVMGCRGDRGMHHESRDDSYCWGGTGFWSRLGDRTRF